MTIYRTKDGSEYQRYDKFPHYIAATADVTWLPLLIGENRVRFFESSQLVEVKSPFDSGMDEIPYGYCKCGCGEKTKIAKRKYSKYGWVKGEPVPYLDHHYKNPITVQPIDRFWSKVDKSGGDDACWNWTGSRVSFRYGKFSVGTRQISAHRFIYEHIHGEIPEGLYVCHRCDNPACVNPKHLFLGTPAENTRDMVTKGRKPKSTLAGESIGTSKLKTDQVLAIRAMHAKGNTSIRAIARQFGVSHNAVLSIVKRQSWNHLPAEPPQFLTVVLTPELAANVNHALGVEIVVRKPVAVSLWATGMRVA